MFVKTALYISFSLLVGCACAFAESSSDIRSIIGEIQTPDQSPTLTVPQAQQLLWDHNGSTVYLIAEGHSRKFFYKEPRPGMLSAGAKPDSLIFEGKANGEQYEGTAYLFDSHCGKLPYQVSGPILDNYERVVLQGKAPRVGTNCRIQGYLTDSLEFNLLKPSEVATAPTGDPERVTTEGIYEREKFGKLTKSDTLDPASKDRAVPWHRKAAMASGVKAERDRRARR